MNTAKISRKGGRPSSVWAGKRYGNLVAIERIKDELASGVVWLMQCDCGCRILATSTHLRTLTHCGCQSKRWKAGTLGYRNRIFKKRPTNQAVFLKQIYARYRLAAQKRGYIFDLTLEEFVNLIAQPCHYCGVEYGNIFTYRGEKLGHNGIDRKNNELGYTIENSISCCGACNEAKMDRPYQEFIDWVHRVHNYLTKGQPDGRIED